MKDLIRKLSLQALKRFSTGGDSIPDLLLQLDELKATIEKRGAEHEEHLAQVRKERDHWVMLYDEAKFAVQYLADAAKADVPELEKQTPWECGMIQLPKEPATFYFNPAVLRMKDGRVILFARRCRNKRQAEGDQYRGLWTEENDIVAFELNNEMRAVNKSILALPTQYPNENFEDPRVVVFGEHIGLSCCSFVPMTSYAHQTLFLLNQNLNHVGRFDPLFGKNYAQAGINEGHEKNWLWFVNKGSPHMVYSANPHTVVRFDGRLEKQEVYQTFEFNPLWKFGEVRGGSTPILVDGLYWTFFHSSLPWVGGKRRYYMGAYAFQPEAPFRIVRMTTMPLLSGSNKKHWWPGLPAVVFPCGAFFDTNTLCFTVVYGVNDVACGYIKIPFTDLIDLTREIKKTKDEVRPEEPESFYDIVDPAPPFEGKPTDKYDKVVQSEK